MKMLKAFAKQLDSKFGVSYQSLFLKLNKVQVGALRPVQPVSLSKVNNLLNIDSLWSGKIDSGPSELWDSSFERSLASLKASLFLITSLALAFVSLSASLSQFGPGSSSDPLPLLFCPGIGIDSVGHHINILEVMGLFQACFIINALLFNELNLGKKSLSLLADLAAKKSPKKSPHL